jgi:glycosyltransferase involved in cell wall biosynthesis
MSMGKAIVATHLGAEGLDVKDGVEILLGDTAEDFARQVVRVLDDPLLAQRLGEAARHSAETRYSWRGAVNRLERFYDELPPRSRSR